MDSDTSESAPALVQELERLRTHAAQLENGPGEACATRASGDAARQWAADVGRFFCRTLDLDAVTQRIALGVQVLLRAQASTVWRFEPDSGDLTAVAASGAAGPAFAGNAVFPARTGVIGLAVQVRQPVVTSNLLTDHRVRLPPEIRACIEQGPWRAALAVPLVVNDQVTGALGVGDAEGRVFTEGDIELAWTLADQATVALEHARLYAEAQQRLQRTETLLNVSQTVVSTLDLTEVMRRVARETCRALGADMVGAFLPDATEEFLRPIAGYHVPAHLVEAFLAYPIPLKGHPILQDAWEHQRPAWSSDVPNDPRVDLEALRRFPHQSSLFFPIVVRGVSVGAFFVAWLRSRHSFTAEEIRLVEGISRQAALAMENARLHDETRQRLRQAETLLAVSHAVTSPLGLTEVVRRTTRELARALGADVGVAYCFSSDRNEVLPLAGYHVPKELLKTVLPDASDAAKSLIATTQTWPALIHASDSAADPRFDHPWVRILPHKSVLVVRMCAKDEILGWIWAFWTREPHRFTSEEIRLAEAVARQAAVAVENARTLEAEQALERRQETLMALGRELSSEIDLQRLLQRIVARSCDLMGTDSALLLLLDGDDLLFRGAIGVDDALRAIGRLDVNTSLTGVVVRERRPLLCPDLREDPAWRDTPVVKRFGYRAMLAVPLVYQNRTHGVLKLLHREPRSFDAEDVAFLGALATEAAMAIENARLYDEAARGRREAETIADLVRTINASLDLDTTLQRITEAARHLCQCDLARIALREPGEEAATIRSSVGAHRTEDDALRIDPGKGVGGRVLATGRPFRTADYANDPRITRDYLAVIQAEGIVAQLVVPIESDGSVEGLLYVSNRSPRPFTDRDEAVLSRLAEHAALAIKNAQLFLREQEAHAASEVSQQRFRDLVESLDAIVWEGDAATCALSFVSRSAETILGYPVEQWLTEPAFALNHLHPDDRETTAALWRAAALDGADHQIEYRMVAADGRVVWLHDTMRVVHGADGRTGLLRGVKVDITELKRAQQHREIQFSVTRLLTDATSLGEAFPGLLRRMCESLGWAFGEFWRVDAGAGLLRAEVQWHHPSLDLGEFVAVTRGTTFARGIGLPGRAWSEDRPVWIPDLATEGGLLRTTVAARAGLHGAFAFPVRSGGEVIGVLVFFSRRIDPPDEHLLKLVSDLGLQIGQFVERKRAQEALAHSELQYRSLVQGATYGICRTSLDGKFLTVNPALVAMLGYESEEELLSVNLETDVWVHPDERSKIVEEHKATGRVPEREVQWKRKDGKCVTVRGRGRVILSIDGAPETFEMIMEDVTARRQLEDQLRQAQKMEGIGQLAGGVAHDFNNLLTVIIGRSKLLLDRLGADHLARHDLELVHKTATRAAGLTRQLLAFSRKQVLQPKVLDLNEVVSGMGKLLQRLIGEHIELTLRPGAGPLMVNADPGQLEQVIMNLALNARDAMPDGGRLVIETADVGAGGGPIAAPGADVRRARVLLAVTDTGCGMDAETRSRIFEPFFTTKGPGHGTGLGLATVYGIVTQSDSHIEVDSEPGRGTTFRIYLPRVEGSTQTCEVGAATHNAPRGAETILLVEDEEDVRDLAREILELNGYTVLEASHPHEALHLCERHGGKIDLMMTDVVMPAMRGDALAGRVARLRPTTKVLYMSGYIDGGIVASGTLEPGVALVQKPFNPERLLEKIREVLEA